MLLNEFARMAVACFVVFSLVMLLMMQLTYGHAEREY
jgi:hypothetical protein